MSLGQTKAPQGKYSIWDHIPCHHEDDLYRHDRQLVNWQMTSTLDMLYRFFGEFFTLFHGQSQVPMMTPSHVTLSLAACCPSSFLLLQPAPQPSWMDANQPPVSTVSTSLLSSYPKKKNMAGMLSKLWVPNLQIDSIIYIYILFIYHIVSIMYL